MDYVFPYVNSSDPTWKKCYEDYCFSHKIKIDNAINCKERFQDPTEIVRFHFRGIDKFMPFVDRVFFIVQSYSQVPDWLDMSKVNVILHKDFIPQEYLPTYNSNTIETFLDRIPGLKNEFIYANDDMIPTAPLTEEDFFKKGKPKFFLNKRKIYRYHTYFRELVHNMYQTMLLSFPEKASEYEPKYFLCPQHLPIPLVKDTITKCKQLFPNILKGVTNFRGLKNINPYFCLYYHYFTDNYVDTKLDGVYKSKERQTIQGICSAIKEKHKYICVNDTGMTEYDYKAISNTFLEIMPNKSRFEKSNDIQPYILESKSNLEILGFVNKFNKWSYSSLFFNIIISDKTEIVSAQIGKKWVDTDLKNLINIIDREHKDLETYFDKKVVSAIAQMEKFMPIEYSIDNSIMGLKKKNGTIQWRQNGVWKSIESYEEELKVYDDILTFIQKI